MGRMFKTKIVKIGNSQGVRIPKAWLGQLAIGTEVEVAMEADQIVIRPAHWPRRNWEQQFREMAALEDGRMFAE